VAPGAALGVAPGAALGAALGAYCRMTATADTQPAPLPPFLAGGGEMAALIAAYDWSRTPLGPISTWPPCLCTALGMILRSPAAMVLMWGEHGIMLYNQAYIAIAAQRHPAILGMPADKAWPETADFSRHVVTSVMAGKSISFNDIRLALNRNGRAEDVWLTLAFSPALDATGQPAGGLGLVMDTTARNLADERLRIAQEAGRFGTFEWYPETHHLIVSSVYRQIYGLTPDEPVTDQKLLRLLPEEDRALSGNVRYGQPGNPLAYAEYRIHHARTGTLRWIARRGEIMDGGQGTPQRYIGVAWDITEKKIAELQDAFLAALSGRLRDISDPRRVAAVAVQMLGTYLGAGRVGFGAIDQTRNTATVTEDWTDGTLPSAAGQHDLRGFGNTVLGALQRGEAMRIDDTHTDPRARDAQVAAAFAAIGARANLSVPLVRDQRFTGVLYAQCAAPRAWTDGDEALMRAVAARVWDSIQRAQAEQLLRESEENFRLLAQAMPNQVWVANPKGRVIWINQQASAYTGVAVTDLDREDWVSLTHPDDAAGAVAGWMGALQTTGTFETEYRIRRVDGAYRWHIVRAMPIRDSAGAVTRWIGTNTDSDEQRRALAELVRLNSTLEERVEARTQELREAEAALRQSQKMEAIGQLTGGIAHDFNNLLTGIIGSLDLVRRRLGRVLPPDNARLAELERFMEAATASANRAAALTHRLLAFARRQSLDTKPVDVTALVQSMADLLRRTLGETIRLRIESPSCDAYALTDPHQLESAILNLAINARDAMPGGGELTIGTAARRVNAETTADADPVAPGDYISIAVTDTGTGMANDVVEKAFEPFFTTKPSGQGTGLGLSMVYGFARQSGGQARIDSQQGAGTTVTLLLPRAAAAPATHSVAPPKPPPGAGETVLVVEDVPAVRMLIVEILRDMGYQTLEAADAEQALPILAAPSAIDLLVSDIGLPGMNGRLLATEARTRRPGLKVLLVTGYAEDAARGGFLEPGMEIMTKPFAIDQLAAKISDMMAV
jgi:PAS domain S-box-containing protein